MRFSFFAVFSCLAALAVVSALPAENLQRDVPFEDTNCSGESDCSGQQITHLDCHGRLPITMQLTFTPVIGASGNQ